MKRNPEKDRPEPAFRNRRGVRQIARGPKRIGGLGEDGALGANPGFADKLKIVDLPKKPKRLILVDRRAVTPAELAKLIAARPDAHVVQVRGGHVHRVVAELDEPRPPAPAAPDIGAFPSGTATEIALKPGVRHLHAGGVRWASDAAEEPFGDSQWERSFRGAANVVHPMIYGRLEKLLETGLWGENRAAVVARVLEQGLARIAGER